jgi:predicted nucleic acid-binding Zn ribbon protein
VSEPGPQRLGEVLSGAGAQLPLEHPVETGKLWRSWRKIVGDAVAAHAQPSSFRGRVLRVRADSPVWATEIGYLADEIKGRANSVLGRELVREVRVWTGPPPRPSRESEPSPGPTEPSDGLRPAASVDPVEALSRARAAWARGRLRARR